MLASELIDQLKPREARFQKTARSPVFVFCGASRESLKR